MAWESVLSLMKRVTDWGPDTSVCRGCFLIISTSTPHSDPSPQLNSYGFRLFGGPIRNDELKLELQDETLQSHRRDVGEPRDRRGQQNPLASAGGFQMVPEDDHRQRGDHGPQNFRKPRQTPAQPRQHRADPASGPPPETF